MARELVEFIFVFSPIILSSGIAVAITKRRFGALIELPQWRKSVYTIGEWLVIGFIIFFNIFEVIKEIPSHPNSYILIIWYILFLVLSVVSILSISHVPVLKEHIDKKLNNFFCKILKLPIDPDTHNESHTQNSTGENDNNNPSYIYATIIIFCAALLGSQAIVYILYSIFESKEWISNTDIIENIKNFWQYAFIGTEIFGETALSFKLFSYIAKSEKEKNCSTHKVDELKRRLRNNIQSL